TIVGCLAAVGARGIARSTHGTAGSEGSVMRLTVIGMSIAKLQPRQVDRASGRTVHVPINRRLSLAYVTLYTWPAARVSATSGGPCSQHDRSLSGRLLSL